MLEVTIPEKRFFIEATSEIITLKEQKLQLEHSLISIHKWESKWHKPYITEKPKSMEEQLDYIRCMTLTKNVDPIVYKYIPNDVIEKINAYIENPMTATVINKKKQNKSSKEFVTAELIYYWMISNDIPVEFEKWHLNSLLTLIDVCQIKNNGDKMSSKETRDYYRAMNAARRKKK